MLSNSNILSGRKSENLLSLKNFRNAVLEDGGAWECPHETTELFNKLSRMGLQYSFIFPSGAYKAGKMYGWTPNGLTWLDVVRATNTSRISRAGLLETKGNNIPQVEYQSGQLKGTGVWGSSTNLALHNTNLSDGYWSKSPNCNFEYGNDFLGLPSVKITPTSGQTTGTNLFGRFAEITTPSTNRHIKTYVKYDGLRYFALTPLSSFSSNPAVCAVFDLKDGIVTAFNDVLTPIIKPYNDEWWEICVEINTSTAAYTNNAYTQLRLGASSSSARGDVVNFVGNGVDGFTIAVPQAFDEGASRLLGAPPIITTSTTATRNADSLVASNASSVIGQTSGTVYVEVDISNIDTGVFRSFIQLSASIGSGDYSRVILGKGENNRISARLIYPNVPASPVIAWNIISSTITQGIFKIALSYDLYNGSNILSVNGATVGSNTTAVVDISTLQYIILGGSPSNPTKLDGRIALAWGSDQVLTESQLNALTTL